MLEVQRVDDDGEDVDGTELNVSVAGHTNLAAEASLQALRGGA